MELEVKIVKCVNNNKLKAGDKISVVFDRALSIESYIKIDDKHFQVISFSVETRQGDFKHRLKSLEEADARVIDKYSYVEIVCSFTEEMLEAEIFNEIRPRNVDGDGMYQQAGQT